MANGGRIVRHLMQRLSSPENTVLFVGYQGTGTLGSALVGCHIDPTVACATEVKIYGTPVQVKAKLEFMSDYSGHADSEDLIALMGKLERNPKMTFIVHGSPAALDGLKEKIETRLNWKAVVPTHKETFIL
jgi:metallo-beta-lactamase family protein